jgi:nitrogen fixation NifU-like protein
MIDRQALIDNILDHYEHPRHRGRMDGATVTMRGGNPGCGDIIQVYLKLDGERITDVSFEGEGCTISQAAASILSEQIIGRMLDDVKNMDHTRFIDDLGRDVVINRLKCATLALNTVKAAERKYREQQAGTAPGEADSEVVNF